MGLAKGQRNMQQGTATTFIDYYKCAPECLPLVANKDFDSTVCSASAADVPQLRDLIGATQAGTSESMPSPNPSEVVNTLRSERYISSSPQGNGRGAGTIVK